MKREEFERVILYFDAGGDGKISASKLTNCVGLTGEDIKEDVLLGVDDFFMLIQEGKEEDKMEDLRMAFMMYDIDGNGFITPKSLQKMLRKLGQSKSIDECMVMIKHFDLNGDGMLCFEEFRAMML